MPAARKIEVKNYSLLSKERVGLTPGIIEGFVSLYLWERFDAPKKIPRLHREIWELFCDPAPRVSVAAPRGFAKSTAGTLSCTLASVLFGAEDHVLLVGATEAMASVHLKDIGTELDENEDIRAQFDLHLVVSNATEIIGYVGGRPFRIICKGEGQSVRGIKWRHKRPGLIVIDDLEEDEAVESVERRTKLREWMDNAVEPLGSDSCKIRAFGTILHFDSWLERTMHSKLWKGRRYSAHKDFDDFSELLWEEKFPEERLREIRQRYVESNNPTGYSKEYLNHPIAESDAYFRRDDFLPMTPKDHKKNKNYYIGGDFAISKKNKANHTSFTVGGVDPENFLHIVHHRMGRWDSLEIVDNMFELQKLYEPKCWFLEEGQIKETMMPFLRLEMARRGIWMNIVPMPPIQDKPSRAQILKARMRAHNVKFDKEADWYAVYEMILLQFPRSSNDDPVDSSAWLGVGCDSMQEALTFEEMMEQEWEEEVAETSEQGRNKITGY